MILLILKFNYTVAVVYEEKDVPTVFITEDFRPTQKSNLESVDYVELTGLDITEFISRNATGHHDTITSFKTAFDSFVQRSPVIKRKFSPHYKWTTYLPISG